MAHLPTQFCKQVAAARREQGITQSALAKSVGCKQSAVSMFESGHPEKLSIEAVEKIAEILKIPLDAKKTADLPEFTQTGILKKGYCPNSACLSNIPYIINDDLLLWPEIIELTDEMKYCSICGEVLEKSCPECGNPVSAGACCRICGHPRVMAALPPGTELEKWVTQRRDEIHQWRDLIQKNF